jgi:energy-coupling factor transporter ATP-binding protein EcfA2
MPENNENLINRPAIAEGLPKTPIVPFFPSQGYSDNAASAGMSVNDYFSAKLAAAKPTGVENIPLSSFYIGDRYPETRPGTDYEEMAGQQQSALDKLGNGIIKMAGTATNSFASGTVGLLYGIGASILEQRLASLIDNDVTRQMDEASKRMEDALPNYYTKAEQNAEWYSTDNILTANFWSDKIIKNIGFSIGALGGGVAWSSLFRSIGLTNKLVQMGVGMEAATAIEGAMTASPNLQKYSAIEGALTSLSQKYIKTPAAAILKNSDRILTSTMGTFGEASIEGLQNMNEFKDKAIEEYKNLYGKTPTGKDLDDIKDSAEKIGMYTWGFNSILLSLTNYVQLPKILGSSKRADKAMIDKIAQEGVGEDFIRRTATTKFGKLIDGVRGASNLLFSPSEAFEEGMQYSIQIGVNNYFERAYQNKENVNGFFSALSSVMNQGISETFSTKEGLENILIGGISGALQQSGVVGTYVDENTGKTKFGIGKSGTIAEQGLLGFTGERLKNTEVAVKALNKTKVSQVLSDGAKFFGIGMGSQQLRQQSIADNDKLSEKDFEADYTFSYLMPRAKYGKIDSVYTELKHYESQAATEQGFSELKNAGIVNKEETREQFLQRIQTLRQTAKDVNRLYDSIKDRYEGVFDEENKRKYSDDVIDKLVYSAAKVKNYDDRIPLLNAQLTLAGIPTQAFVDQIVEKGEVTKDVIDPIIDRIKKIGGTADDINDNIENLRDLGELALRRKKFIDDYNEIKEFPEKYKEFETREKKTQGPETTTEPEAPKYKNAEGAESPLELEREYSIAPFKEATIDKLGEDKYEVISPDGTSFVYSTKEAAEAAADKVNKQSKGLEKVKVLEFNKNGTVKIQDSNGDIYDVPASKFEGYQRLKTEQEKLEKVKDDVEQQQKELELSDSGTIDSVPFTDDKYKGNPEDKRKFWSWLFWSTTSASEDRDADSKKPHAQRSIAFHNNFRKFANKANMRVMVVTSKQEDALGLTGLHKLSMGEDVKRDASGNVIIDNTDNALIAAVYVEQQGSNYYFVDKDGKRIGKVGDQVDLNQVVFSTMPNTSLYWDEGGKNAERFRIDEKAQAEEMSQRWALKRKQLFEIASDKPEIYSFRVSNGIPIINDIKERNHIGGTLIEESKIKSQEGLIVVSTKGTLSHNGQSYKIREGRSMIQYEDVFVPAVNHKFNRNQAESIYEVLRLLAADIQKQSNSGKKVKFNPIYTRYLSNLLYWKKAAGAKGGANQMFIDSKMNLILGDKKYDITKLEDSKKQIIDQLLDAYHTINNKSLTSTEEAGINKFHEKFVEFYVENGELKEREWTNYQTYLLSAKYPDGNARSANDTPVTTFVAKPTDLVPYNFKQKYAILSETEFPALPVKSTPAPKSETPPPSSTPTPGDVVKAGKYNVGKTEYVKNTYTDFKSIGPITFNAKLATDNTSDIEIVPDDATQKSIFAISEVDKTTGEESPILGEIRKRLGKKFNEDDIEFSVAFFIKESIRGNIDKTLSEKKSEEAPKPEAPPVTAKPVTIKIGDTEFILDGKTVYTSTDAFKAPVQFTVSPSDKEILKVKVDLDNQSSNYLSQLISNPDAMKIVDETLKIAQKENYNPSASAEEKIVTYASFKILGLLKQKIEESAPKAETPSPTPSVTPSTLTSIEDKRKEVKAAIKKAGQGEGGQFFVTLVDGTREGSVRISLVGNELGVGNKGVTVDLATIVKVENPDGTILYDSKPAVSTDAKADIERRRELSISEFDESQGEWNTFYYNSNNDTEIIEANSKNELLDKINAKYDAELSALEGAKPAEATPPSVSAPISKIDTEIAELQEQKKKLEKYPEQLRNAKDKEEVEKIVKEWAGFSITDTRIVLSNVIFALTMPSTYSQKERTEAFEVGKKLLYEKHLEANHLRKIKEVDEQIKAKYEKKYELEKESTKKSAEAPTPPVVETPPPTPKKKKGGKKHDDSGEYRLVETTPSKKEKISQADIEIFKKWHNEVAPGIPYEISEKIFMLNDGRRAYGMFVDGIAKFYKGAIRGTEYHEIFEGIWAAFLTSEERAAILEQLKAKSGSFTDRETGKKIKWDEATDKQIKERIADDFADYRLGKLPARSLSEKIVRFFKNIIQFVKNLVFKSTKVDRLFDDIEKGRFKSYVVPESAKSDIPEYSVVEGLTQTDTRLYVEDMTAIIFQYLFGSNKSLYDIQKLTDKDLYNHVLQKYQDSEKIDDTDPDFLSTKQFGELFSRTKEFLRQFKIEFDDSLVVDVNNNESDNRSYAPEPFATDWKKHSGYPIKLLLGTLTKTKPSGNLDANNLSTPQSDWSELNGFQLLNFSKAFATVMDKLHNTSSVKRVVEKLVNLASLNTDYYRLLGRLKLIKAIRIVDGVMDVDFSSFENHDWRLFIQFYQTFTKQKPIALVQYSSGDNVYTSPANLFTAAEEVKSDWLSNMKLLAKERDSLITYNPDTKRYQVGDISKIPTSTPEEKVEFLKKLGINFPLSTYLRLSVKKEVGERSEQAKFDDAVSSIQKYISKDSDIASVTGDALKIDSAIKKLAELYIRVENPPHETTRFNIEGERVNEFAENNHTSVFENEMNESPTLDEVYVKRPELNDVFSKSSIVLKKGGLFYDEDGNQIKKFKIKYIEGNKDIDGGKDVKISRLSRGDAAVLQFNQNLNGDYYILVPADSSTEWMINLGNNISYNDVVGGRAWDKIYTIFRNYLNDEVELAMSDRSYLDNTAPRAKELRFFKEILPKDMVEKIHSLIKEDANKDDINKYIDDRISDVNSSVKSFIESSNQDMVNDLIKFKRVYQNENDTFNFPNLDGDFAKAADVNKRDLSEKEFNDIMMFRNINYVINNIEMHKVIFGDPYQFKIKNNQLDETKRTKSFLSPRRTTVDFPQLNTALNQDRNNAEDIPLEPTDPGYHLFSPNINTVTLSDVDVAGIIYSKFDTITTETDGFSFMMDNVYRELKIKNGQWIDEKAEPWHQWQMAYTRNKLAKKGQYTYTNEKLKAQDEKMISKPAPKHMIEVLKTIVSGNKANRTYFDNVLDKFSQMPLYYSMVEGTNLEDMYIKMYKEKIGYAVYGSGRKVGAESLYDVYKKNGELNTAPFDNIIQVPWKILGVQVETTYEDFHEDLTRGSQTTKISTIDLFENGEAVNEKIAEEYKRYVRTLNAYHKNGVEELFNKLGLEHLGDGKFNIVDPVALSESLKHELLRREASDNVKYVLELDENGQFRVPFESSNAYIQIRDIIFSMVDKSVNSPKMHGAAYVQSPVTMFEKLGSSRSLGIQTKGEDGKFTYTKITKEKYAELSSDEQKNVYLTDDTLKMPTPDDPYMEVMLPHWFREKLPKKYKGYSDDELLRHLNNTEDGRKLLNAFGFRIPTQALSSMAALRVKGFLPQYMGHTVIVPSEITTMAGSDFDIDKMFIYLKSYYLDANDNIRIVSLINESEEETKQYYKNVYEETIQKQIDKITKFDEFRDKILDVFEKVEQFDEITLENLELLSDEDFEFYTDHAVLLNEMMEQAGEERLSPREYILDQINKLGGKKEKLTQKMLNDDVKEKYIKKMYKRALENEYYDSLEKLITSPVNYERNIAPVDDAGFKKVAEELDYLTGDVGENVKNRLLNASYMSKLRHSFITAKRWVGIAAVNLTGHSNAQKSKLYLDTNRFSNLSKKDKEILGNGSIALPHNTVTVGNRTYTSMSGKLTADGKGFYISSRLSGYATTFVDVAKDPYIMKIIKSELAVGTFMFLERIGAGETVPFFMNQPIIRAYLEQLDESNFRSLFNNDQIAYIRSEFPTTEELINETQLDVSLKSLKDNIELYRENKTDDAYNAMQQKMLTEFLKYAKMAEYSFKLTQASNYDTTRFRSGNSLFKKQTRTDVASESNIFSSVDEVLKNTHLGEQAYFLDLAVQAVGEYLQLDKEDIRQNITDDILRPYAEDSYLSDDKYEAIGTKVATSLLDFIIQTKTGLNSEIAELTSDSSTSAVGLLMKAKEKFPNDDLIQLLEPRQARTGGPWTIKLKGNAKASGYDENYFIGKMRELRDNGDPETQELTTNLYKALVKISILQGSQQSAMSIKNIVPAEDYEKQIGDSMRNLRYTPEMDVFKRGMFYRNQWKNDDIFKKVNLNYNYADNNFPTIKPLGITMFSRSVLTLNEKYHMRHVSSDYLKMDRFIINPEYETEDEMSVKDLLTGRTYSNRQYRTMLAKGETVPKEILGFEKVKYPDGSPVLKYDKDGNKTYIYKRINLYGDAGYVSEYYKDFKKSVLNNGTSKVEKEANTDDLIRHFTSKEIIKPNEEPVTGTSQVTFTPEETPKNIETKTFEQFGTQYRFTLENGNVVSGEFKQGGKDWQAMNPKNVASKYTALSQEVSELPFTEEESTLPTIFETRNVQIDYTTGQRKALSDVQNLINANKQGYYLLAGYAGTGKTTIAENIARYAATQGRPAKVLAPTNKAAKVLNDKLKAAGVASEASTIHKSIYGEPDPITGEWVIGADIKNSVIIIDESSMISKELMTDLLNATNRNNILIFMGDSFQLEPVGEDSGLFKGKIEEVKNNQTELTEVKRQSLDSNVLKVATITRVDGKPYIPETSIQDFKVTSSRNEFVNDFKSAIKNGEDVVMIVATNNERVAMNNIARQEKFGAQKTLLNEGDVMISVANSTAYPNSEIFEISEVGTPVKKEISLESRDGKISKYDAFFIDVKTKDNKPVTMLHIPLLDKPSFYHGQLLQYAKTNPEFMNFLESKGLIIQTKKGFKVSPSLVIATYGYSVTAHKSQGSQWSKVFVNQNYVAPSWNGARWYYTAITRSSKDVIVLNSGNNVPISSIEMNSKLNVSSFDESSADVQQEFPDKQLNIQDKKCK